MSEIGETVSAPCTRGPPAREHFCVLRPWLLDDRDRRCRLYWPGWSCNLRRPWRVLGPGTSLLVLGVLVAYAAIVSAALAWGPIVLAIALFSPAAAFQIFALISVALAVRRALERGAERLRRDLVRTGLCASCGYDLGATPVQADGCHVCAECGSAWNATLRRYVAAEDDGRADAQWTRPKSTSPAQMSAEMAGSPNS